MRYAAVDDVGRAINPMILHGQTHGAIAQGVGQALWEQCVVDADSGQVMTGSFMDYAMPRSDILPTFKTGADGNTVAVESARRARRRRGRYDAGAGRRDQCHRRRAEGLRRDAYGNAGDVRDVSGARSRMASTRNPRTFGA